MSSDLQSIPSGSRLTTELYDSAPSPSSSLQQVIPVISVPLSAPRVSSSDLVLQKSLATAQETPSEQDETYSGFSFQSQPPSQPSLPTNSQPPPNIRRVSRAPSKSAVASQPSSSSISPIEQRRRPTSSIHPQSSTPATYSSALVVDTRIGTQIALAPSPPHPSERHAVTLSHRSGARKDIIYFDDSHWQLCEDALTKRRRSGSTSTKAAAATSTSSPAATPTNKRQDSTPPPASTTSSSAYTSAVPTPLSFSIGSMNTPATTTSNTPLSPSLKSDASLSATPLDSRQDASMPDSTTPTPPSAAPAKPSVPAWSKPRAWTGLQDPAAASFSFTSEAPSAASSSSNINGGPEPAAVSSPSSPPTSRVANGAPARQQPSAPKPWAAKPKLTLEALLADAHTRSTAPLTAPRGLINKGNFCFANAILQVLVFCAPFYNLFMTVGQELSADFANTTPLMEAVVQFLREFTVVEKKRGTATMERVSEPFVPEFVYEAMTLNKRFDLMRRGRQEDAEEFLGFFLDTLHEELQAAIQKSNARRVAKMSAAERKANDSNNAAAAAVVEASNAEDAEEEEREVSRPVSPTEEGWMEVGQKGKTAFTRTTSAAGSPISNIFGGKLRSILKTPGAKDSVTLEPYQPLQLDIQPHSVVTVEDALLNLTVPETIPGVYSPARGGLVDATKQVFIERTPPVLILHLKRFFYDEVGGVQKNTKEVGYGDRLEVRGDMLSPTRRMEGSTHYRLFGVVYHHGRYATGGHYTVDVLRQDGSGWVHFDDTHYTPVASEHIGRKPGQKRDPNGHDGLAYLLFYRQIEKEEVAATAPAAAPNGHERTASNRYEPAVAPATVNGNGKPAATAPPKKKKEGKESKESKAVKGVDAIDAAPATPAVPERRTVPGAAPGKTRKTTK